MTKFKLDRKKLVEYYPIVLSQMILRETIREDIIKGGEFIITAEDLLQEVEFIDGKLVGDPSVVHHSDIELVYDNTGQ